MLHLLKYLVWATQVPGNTPQTYSNLLTLPTAFTDVTYSPEDKLLIQTDSMESFWLAETLKYYYLLFSEPELISLYVLLMDAVLA